MTLLIVATILAAEPNLVEPEEVARTLDGQTIVVEDAVSSVLGPPGRRQIRLRRCPQVSVQFEGQSPKEIAGNVRITGKVQADAGSISIVADRIEALPSDDDTLESRSNLIAPADAESWYALSEWALHRYRLYDDERMKEKGALAYRKGLSAERAAAAGDAKRLTQLRDRLVAQRIVKDPDLEDLDHEILHARWKHEALREIDVLEQFADEVVRVLDPDRTALPPPVPKELAHEYDRAPVATFRAALPAQRRSLTRHWEISMRQQILQARVMQNSLSHYEAGEWALQHLRDYPDIGKEWIEKGVSRDAERLPALSAREVETMTDHIRLELSDPKEADRIQSRWIEGRWDRLRDKERRAVENSQKEGRAAPPRDARARFDLASLQLAWRSENQQAVAWAIARLKEAAEIEPSYEEPQSKLRSLGYRRTSDGRWLSRDESAQQDTAQTISAGMSPEQVEKILGRPDARSAVITAGGIEAIWTYRVVSNDTYVIFRGSDAKSLQATGTPVVIRGPDSGK